MLGSNLSIACILEFAGTIIEFARFALSLCVMRSSQEIRPQGLAYPAVCYDKCTWAFSSILMGVDGNVVVVGAIAPTNAAVANRSLFAAAQLPSCRDSNLFK